MEVMMTSVPLLGPASVLILWSLIVLAWLALTRFPAFAKAGINLRTIPSGARYSDVEKEMPARVNWVSHNYTHLLEQPTLFYAVIAVLALAGDSSNINLVVAWSYVVIRIIHSLWQCLINIVYIRSILFLLSTFCLWILAINAVRLTVF